MSRVYVLKIDARGRVDSVGEVENAWNFHVAIWAGLMKIHGIHDGRITHDLKKLGQLWCRAATLPPMDGLLLAATFDRCWFPIHVVPTLIAAMCEERRFRHSAGSVAHIVERVGGVGARGFAFSGSVATPWSCHMNEDTGNHVLDHDGHACRLCEKRIQDAEHLLQNLSCCAEPTDGNYEKEAW